MKLQNTKRDMRVTFAFGLTVALTVLLGIYTVPAQSVSIFASGLNTPSKIIPAGGDSLMVAEAGTLTPNNGRISLVNRTTGARQTLIDGLPSAPSLSGGAPETSGPSGLKLIGQKLYLSIGAGDTLMPVTGGFVLNPTPSSPLLSSVLELNLPADYETLASSFTLSFVDQTTLNGGGLVTLTNLQGKQLTLRVLVNLPNSVPNPLPALPGNTRESNPYGLEFAGDSLYVVDASFNLIYRVVIANGAFSTFATFAPKPNPTQVGPPFIDAVPDSIRLVGNNLIISFLTGFPFVQGLAEVRTVNLDTGSQTVLIPNLTSALDVLPINAGGSNDSYFVVEFSSNMLMQAPGRLKLFASAADTAPRIYVDNLITPSSIAPDPRFGIVYVTERSPGRIRRIVTTTAARVEVSGRVVTPDGHGLRNALVTMTDQRGITRTAATSSFGYYTFNDAPAGESFVLSVSSKRFRFVSRIIEVFDNLTNVDFVGQE